ncbi:hypothetical protein SLEP1_g50079 [Rubroshorea leprosula]|uniref:Uncharacterized protein n=1 Tax=Rubroshorea leprosula TaxID=152421 RepID=A0AAV5LYZ3_9ROSI|nr:hypothetical protein SLEP1_g50079 [Rubroshorea leprosula]
MIFASFDLCEDYSILRPSGVPQMERCSPLAHFVPYVSVCLCFALVHCLLPKRPLKCLGVPSAFKSLCDYMMKILHKLVFCITL